MTPGRLIDDVLSRVEPTFGERDDEYRGPFLAAGTNLVSLVFILSVIFIPAFVYNNYLFFGLEEPTRYRSATPKTSQTARPPHSLWYPGVVS